MKKRLGKPLIAPNPKHTGGTHYQDEKGNTITKEKYEELQAAIDKKAAASLAKNTAKNEAIDNKEGAK